MKKDLKLLRFVKEVSHEHVLLLGRLCKETKVGTPVELLLQRDRGDLWFFTTPAGLVLLQIIATSKGSELYVRGIVGRGILKQAEDLVSDLRVIAQHYDCTAIYAEALRGAWARVCKRIGFGVRSVNYEMELG